MKVIDGEEKMLSRWTSCMFLIKKRVRFDWLTAKGGFAPGLNKCRSGIPIILSIWWLRSCLFCLRRNISYEKCLFQLHIFVQNGIEISNKIYQIGLLTIRKLKKARIFSIQIINYCPLGTFFTACVLFHL